MLIFINIFALTPTMHPSFQYNSAWVCIYVTLEGVGAVKSNVECDFSTDGFDLRVHDLNGKNYRLVKTNLEKDIADGEATVAEAKARWGERLVIAALAERAGSTNIATWGLSRIEPRAP